MVRDRRVAAAVGLAALLSACPAAHAEVGPLSDPVLAAQFALPARADALDGGGPLDVRRVVLGQTGVRLSLELRTEGPWAARDLFARGGRGLCVVLAREQPSRAIGRLCAGPRRGDTVLRYQPIDRSGRAGAWRRVGAGVSRPDGRWLRASFAPSAIGLALGSFRWSVRSRWQDDAACAAGCEDRVPDSGAFASAVTVLAPPRCFAAAARDRVRRCDNPALRHVLVPTPADAPLLTNSPCRLVPLRRRSAVLHPCEFGVTGERRTGSFALIGDSHAATWRAALDVVAHARRWRGVSITRPGCPFSTRVPASPDLGPAQCVALHSETLAWLRAHREVRTIFVAGWAQPRSGPQGGSAGYGGDGAAYGAMLDMVPRSVRRIYVLRDNPGTTLSSQSCVRAAYARRLRLGGRCAAPRASVLTADPAVAAAAVRRPRVRVVDLTRVFCGAASCYPVIGGGYVYKDDSHMNRVFATSLGPFVLRALTDAP